MRRALGVSAPGWMCGFAGPFGASRRPLLAAKWKESMAQVSGTGAFSHG